MDKRLNFVYNASLPLSDEREEERIVRVEDEEELLRRLMLSFSF